MKNAKYIFQIVIIVLIMLTLTACENSPQKVITSITVAANKYEAEINEIIVLSIVAKDQFDEVMNVANNKYTITTTAGNNSTVNDLTISFSETGTFIVKVKVNNTAISENIICEVYENPIKSVEDRKALGANISAKIYFQLSHDFIFSDYNFLADQETDLASWGNEYGEAYDKFFNGNETEKAAAINKLGNDILIRFIAIDDANTKTVLSAKNKAWSGYLNYCPELYASETFKLEGDNYDRILNSNDNDYYSTSINLTAANYLGYTIVVELYIIENGRVFTNSYSFLIS